MIKHGLRKVCYAGPALCLPCNARITVFDCECTHSPPLVKLRRPHSSRAGHDALGEGCGRYRDAID